MKRKALVIIMLLSALFTLSASPSLFLGCGAELGRVYPSDEMLSAVRSNRRYYSEGSRNFRYLSSLVPKAEITVVPYSDFPLGLTASLGCGFVTGMYSGSLTYNYSVKNSSDRYRFGSDDILLLSGGITYIRVKESSVSFSLGVKYNWNRYMLSKNVIPSGVNGWERDNTVIDEHSLSLSIGFLVSSDISFFRFDASLRKDIDFGKGISSLFSVDDFSVTLGVTSGFLFKTAEKAGK